MVIAETLPVRSDSDKTETALDGPVWYLHRHRVGALNRQRDPFDTAAWVQAVEASHLHPTVIETAQHLALDADWYGVSTITRTQLAMAAGVTRVATITARVQRLEAAGYIGIKQRFNQSSQISLTFPLVADAEVQF